MTSISFPKVYSPDLSIPDYVCDIKLHFGDGYYAEIPKWMEQALDFLDYSYTEYELVFNNPNLVELTFGTHFNIPLPPLPSSLRKLSFVHGCEFDQPIDNLPSLLHLELGYHFNYPLDNLPSSLKTIQFGELFDQPLNNLPPSLEKISFFGYLQSRFQSDITFPPNLISLQLPPFFSMAKQIPPLPASLQILECAKPAIFQVPSLPPSLVKLHIRGLYIATLKSFPETLQDLILYDPKFSPRIPIPANCSITTFCSHSLKDIPKTYLPNITHLHDR